MATYQGIRFGSTLISKLRLGATPITAVYYGSTPVYRLESGGGVPSGDTLTIAAGKVSADLIDFPLAVDLSIMPDNFWTSTNAGADLRFFDGATELPSDLVYCDPVNKTGMIFVKVPLISAAAGASITWSTDGVSARPAHTDPNGRNAVWSDYAFCAIPAEDFADRTGNNPVGALNAATVFTPNSGLSGGGYLGLVDGTYTFDQPVPDVSTFAGVFTLGASVAITQRGTNGSFVNYRDLSSGSTNDRVTVTYSGTQNAFGLWDNSNGYLTIPGTSGTPDGAWIRAHTTYDAAVQRDIYFRHSTGALQSASDPAISDRSAQGYDSLLFGKEDESNAERAYGSYGWVYLRPDYLSAAWVAAESDMLTDPMFVDAGQAQPPVVVSPSIKGSYATQNLSADNLAFLFPVEAAEGDLCIIFASSSWAVNTPAGWSRILDADGTSINGEIMQKVLTAADITAGQVTISFTGVHECMIAGVVLDGAPSIRTASQLRRPASGAAISVEADAGDRLLWFIGCRGATATPTTNRTTDTVEQTTPPPGGVLLTEVASAAGTQIAAVTKTGDVYVGAVALAHEAAPPLSEHLYWRIYVDQNNDDPDYTVMCGVEMRDAGGVNQIGAGAATASSVNSADTPAAEAFAPWTGNDAVINNYWSTISGQPKPSWVAYQFPTPVAVHAFTITGVREFDRMPRNFRLQYSDDGVAWQDQASFFNQTNWLIDGTDTRTFAVP